MQTIALFVSDLPLGDALIEQIRAAKLGNPVTCKNADDLRRTAPLALVIADEGALTPSMLREALKETETLPPLFLLGGEEGDDVAESFAKPFRLGHLIARARYFIETAPLLREKIITFGPYRLAAQTRVVTRDDADPIRLTEKENALLAFLAESKDGATRQDILAAVWGYSDQINTHTLETHIYQLRRKLDADGINWLVSDNGRYRLEGGTN